VLKSREGPRGLETFPEEVSELGLEKRQLVGPSLSQHSETQDHTS
jgi:hypothetical protein